jgi:hypothetical protein
MEEKRRFKCALEGDVTEKKRKGGGALHTQILSLWRISGPNCNFSKDIESTGKLSWQPHQSRALLPRHEIGNICTSQERGVAVQTLSIIAISTNKNSRGIEDNR